MEHIVEHRGCITLFFSKAGFAWVMTSKSGMHWYWHPETRHWTGRPYAGRTIRQATAGLGPYGPRPEGPSATLMRAPIGRARSLDLRSGRVHVFQPAGPDSGAVQRTPCGNGTFT